MSRERVRLTCDLTRYDSRLVEGSLGWTGRPGPWGNIVEYDCGAVLDTLWKSLELLEGGTREEERRVLNIEFKSTVKRLLRKGENAADLRAEITRLNKEVRKEPV